MDFLEYEKSIDLALGAGFKLYVKQKGVLEV